MNDASIPCPGCAQRKTEKSRHFDGFLGGERPGLTECSWFTPGSILDLPLSSVFGPQDAWNARLTEEGMGVNGKAPPAERRRWPRLPLAIPVFVRSQAEADKEFLEFATAINVSAGGMLVAVRRSIPSAAQVSLEIPSAPLAALTSLPGVVRNMRAKVLRMQHGEGYNLVGLKFSRPLVNHNSAKPRRKLASSV
jgi:hypothetical protein